MNPKKETNGKAAQIASLEAHMEATTKSLTRIEGLLEKSYVRKEEFKPIKRLVYGATGIMLTAMMVAIVAVIITR